MSRHHDAQKTQHRVLLKRLLREHIVPYHTSFYGAFSFMFVAAVANAAIPFLLRPIFDDIFIQGNASALWPICLAVLGAFFFRGFATFGEQVTMTTIGQRIVCDIQNRLYSHILTLDLAFFHRIPTADLLSRFTNDITLMRTAVSQVIVGVGKDSLSLLMLVGLMFYRDWMLALIALIGLPSIILPLVKISQRIRRTTTHTQGELATLTRHLNQSFQGIRVIQSYAMEAFEVSRMQSLTRTVLTHIIRSVRARSLHHPIVEILAGITITFIIAYGGWQVIHGARSAGEFISFIAALLLAYEPIKRLSNLNAHLQEGLSASQRVFELLDTIPEIVDAPTPQILKQCTGKIIYENVSFSYPGYEALLTDFSLAIQPGQTVALVGPSGAGKTTLLNLLPRFYDPTSGKITLDGVPIRSLTRAHLRSHIALVSQDVVLFDDTVMHNIAYGNLSADTEQVISAAQAAAAHEFIMQLPQGYETIIGENGVRLSGGQRQRLSIARAMLKNAPVLLLDEATSALDSKSEQQIQEALQTLMQGRTTIIVAHRLSTITAADVICVLDQGRIVERGTHPQLLTENGLYAQLWHRQSHQKEDTAYQDDLPHAH